jgi:hypothetical protein
LPNRKELPRSATAGSFVYHRSNERRELDRAILAGPSLRGADAAQDSRIHRRAAVLSLALGPNTWKSYYGYWQLERFREQSKTLYGLVRLGLLKDSLKKG